MLIMEQQDVFTVQDLCMDSELICHSSYRIRHHPGHLYLGSRICAWKLICHSTGQGIIHVTCTRQQDLCMKSHLSHYRTWHHPPHLYWAPGLVPEISSIIVQNRPLILKLKFPILFLNFCGPRKCHLFTSDGWIMGHTSQSYQVDPSRLQVESLDKTWSHPTIT